MIKIIILFLLILNITGCNITKKNPEILIKNNKIESSSNSATYLTANFYISKGDAYTASEILDKKIESPKLLQLKFFSNLISGDFETANKIAISLAPKFKKNDLYHFPKYIMSIKNSKFDQNFEFPKKK